MSKLKVMASLNIHEGKLDEFREIAKACMKCVKKNDKRTLRYDWYYNADQTVCIVRETYKDSQGVFEHMENLGDLLGQLLGVSDLSLKVFGEPSKELIEATSSMDIEIFTLSQRL